MSVPVLIICLVVVIVSGYSTWAVHQMDRVRRDALPTNHPNYKPMRRRR